MLPLLLLLCVALFSTLISGYPSLESSPCLVCLYQQHRPGKKSRKYRMEIKFWNNNNSRHLAHMVWMRYHLSRCLARPVCVCWVCVALSLSLFYSVCNEALRQPFPPSSSCFICLKCLLLLVFFLILGGLLLHLLRQKHRRRRLLAVLQPVRLKENFVWWFCCLIFNLSLTTSAKTSYETTLKRTRAGLFIFIYFLSVLSIDIIFHLSFLFLHI